MLQKDLEKAKEELRKLKKTEIDERLRNFLNEVS
jgi:hypothetical protein